MGDLKSPWESKDQAFTGTDMAGAGVTERGGEDVGDNAGSGSGLQPMWKEPILGNFDKAETANSVSGLPSLPNRFEPTEAPPEMPSLKDRSPLNVDKK
jgi:hypothetical protein